MILDVQCPACQHSCGVNEALLGKVVRCPQCQETFTATAPAQVAAPAAAATDGLQAGPAPSRPARQPPPIAADDGARRRAVRRPQPIAVWIVAGLAVALLLVCGVSMVAGALAWFLWPRGPVPLAGAAGVADPLHAQGGAGGNAAPQWTLDLRRMKVPEQPLTGKVLGADFRVDRAQLVNTGLDLWSGQDWIHIFLTPQPGQNVYEFAADGGMQADRPAIHLHIHSTNPPGVAVHTNGYAMRLELGPAQNGMAQAKLYLCLPDAGRSWLAGTFTVAVH